MHAAQPPGGRQKVEGIDRKAGSMVKNQAIEANACYHRRQADRNISHRCKDRWQVISSAQGQSCSPAESATRKNASSAVNINNMAGRALAVCLALFFAHAAYGQTIVQGCGQGSCNPAATGGNVVADLKASSEQSSGGTDPLGFLGAILPPILAKPGRRLQGHVPNMMLSEVDAILAEPKGHTVSGQRKMLSTTTSVVAAHSNQASNSLRGLRKLQCADTDHQAECNAWGRSSCGLPGVNAKCPCMCGGGGGSRPGGGDTTILVQPVAVGCLGNSCNPAAGGGSASGK